MLIRMTNSDLMKGMAENTIAKEQFYSFLKQDFIYLKRGAEVLTQTAENLESSLNPNNPFSKMYIMQAKKYQNTYEAIGGQLKTEAKIDATTTEPNAQTKEYHKFLIETSTTHPRLLGFAFLPCSQSFRFIANQLCNETENQRYKTFFEASVRKEGYRSELEIELDKLFPTEKLELDKQIFKEIEKIYLKGMKNEEIFIDRAIV